MFKNIIEAKPKIDYLDFSSPLRGGLCWNT